jgi:hypothetical protein
MGASHDQNNRQQKQHPFHVPPLWTKPNHFRVRVTNVCDTRTYSI